MPQEIYQAQPFPGTGLALRIVGEVTPERLHILRRADQMFREDIKTTGLHKRLWKYFAMLYHLDDEEDPQTLAVALRAVSISSMAASPGAAGEAPYDLVEQYGEKVIAFRRWSGDQRRDPTELSQISGGNPCRSLYAPVTPQCPHQGIPPEDVFAASDSFVQQPWLWCCR